MTTKAKDSDTVEKAPVEVAVQMHCTQYFQNFNPDIHDYSKAAIRGQYRDILKSKEEWDAVIQKDLGL